MIMKRLISPLVLLALMALACNFGGVLPAATPSAIPDTLPPTEAPATPTTVATTEPTVEPTGAPTESTEPTAKPAAAQPRRLRRHAGGHGNRGGRGRAVSTGGGALVGRWPIAVLQPRAGWHRRLHHLLRRLKPVSLRPGGCQRHRAHPLQSRRRGRDDL